MNIIKKLMNKIFKPTTGREIHNWLPYSTILKYSDLKKYKKLPKLPLVILYEVKPNIGHWVTILETPEGIEHFDSYGYAPDKELDFVPDEFKSDNKLLLRLLVNHNDINYNQYKLQKGLDTATCGRWVILRNLFNYLTIDQFKHMIDKTSKQLKLSSDQLVTMVI